MVMDLTLIGNAALRAAIQRNLVSFPSQIPAFMKRGDVQERVVQLYFVRAWQVPAICNRYRIGKSQVRKLLSEWRVRAAAAGYIQEIDPDALAILAADPDTRSQEAIELSETDSVMLLLQPPWGEALSAASPGKPLC